MLDLGGGSTQIAFEPNPEDLADPLIDSSSLVWLLHLPLCEHETRKQPSCRPCIGPTTQTMGLSHSLLLPFSPFCRPRPDHHQCIRAATHPLCSLLPRLRARPCLATACSCAHTHDPRTIQSPRRRRSDGPRRQRRYVGCCSALSPQ